MGVKRCSRRLVRIGNFDTMCTNLWESGIFPLGSLFRGVWGFEVFDRIPRMSLTLGLVGIWFYVREDTHF